MVTETELFESPGPNSIRFLFFGFGWRERFKKEGWIHETNCTMIFWMLLST